MIQKSRYLTMNTECGEVWFTLMHFENAPIESSAHRRNFFFPFLKATAIDDLLGREELAIPDYEEK